jgi:hypothetical protein
MRGSDLRTGELFSYVDLEQRVPESHPLRLIRCIVNQVLAAYRARHWEDARRRFTAALEAVPNDGPSATFVKRIDSLLADPPGNDWDGAWRLDQK